MHLLLLVLATICVLRVTQTATDPNHRLNIPIVPSTYQIRVKPYFDTNNQKEFTFDGEVTIQFTTISNINQIKLHAQDLNFAAADVTVTNLNSSTNLPLSNTNPLEFDSYYSFAYINLVSELVPDIQYAVRIIYTGPLRTDLSGFYRTYYMERGVKKWMAATQLEAAHARKAYPCFDEPSLKATFTIQIDRPASYKNSLSNMIMMSSEELGNGYIRESFHTSPIMPTYLVALLVSEYEVAQYRYGTREFGIYTRPEAINQTEYAFDFGRTVIDVLGEYYGIDYYSVDQYLKLDHVPIPDFRTGAMENWGLAKYKESLLLYDPAYTMPFLKYRVAQNLAHESVHFWFGNLVTCHWWSDTWLNEGFACYFQDYITALIEPELGSDNLIVTSSMYSAYDSDEDPTAPPLSNYEVNSPAEIDGQFSRISYQKGGAVIRMIHHLIEDNAFKAGLHIYLSNSALGAGYPQQLYDALDFAVKTYNSLSSYPNATVSDIMGSWVTLSGHPVLDVNIDYATETIILTQKRFYIDASYASNEIYKIPITYTTEISPNFINTKPAFIMDEKTYEFTVESINQTNAWVIFNLQETGFYRVNYDEYSWQLIAAVLNGDSRNTIHYLNRAKIINDLFAFLYANEINFSTLYNVLEFLHEEVEYSVWIPVIQGFNKLRNTYLGHPDTLSLIEAYMLSLMENYINKFDYEERTTDSFEDKRNRQQILEFACKLDHEGCVEHSLAMFQGLKENGTEVYPSLRPVVYSTGLRFGTAEDYDFLWNRVMTTNHASEVFVIIEALGYTSDNDKLKSYLVSMTVENSPVRTQDLWIPLTTVLTNYTNLPVVMNQIKNDYSLWNSIYSSMDSVLSSVALNLRTEGDFNEFEAFLTSCSDCSDLAKAAARVSIERARASKAWADRHEADILLAIRSNSSTVVSSLCMIIMGLAVLFSKY